MEFTSTRSCQHLSASQTIVRGIAEDGGLFVPVSFPRFREADLEAMIPMNYKERACRVLSAFLGDFSAQEVRSCVEGAYTGTFENEDPAPLREVKSRMHLLELWHGPTCAFKDMALQLLPRLLTVSAAKNAPGETMVILVATSGDTGKAALDGFADVPGTKIIVFFPQNGVSPMQKLQMTTQQGANVAVCAIEGNFDDAQTGVKQIFGDRTMHDALHKNHMSFSSANSINFGRLVPQIVYYVSAYCDLRRAGKLKAGEKFLVAVPTGNFGNILAAYYAKRMGVPVGKLLCASNRNNILTDFLSTGVYDRNRPFYTTSSPSMDILISSNLERLLYHLSDAQQVSSWMADLKRSGRYQVPAEVLAALQQEFCGGFCDDAQAAESIGKLFRENHYLCDPHTAVAVHVLEEYRKKTGDAAPCVVASTASPYKFAQSVLPAIGGRASDDGFVMIEELSRLSGTAIPAPLASLRSKEVLHRSCVEKTQMPQFVLKTLGC